MIKHFFSSIVKFFRLPIRFIKYFLLSIVNNYSFPKKISKKLNFDLIVVSTGGVATTTLINYLKLYKNLNDENDSDGYKHLNKFPFIENDDLKIIYVYGDYKKIYNSLKRRNIFQSQMVKLGCPLCYLLSNKIERFFFRFCINKQINNFKNKKNVFILNFDNIWENKEEIKEFLQIEDSDFVKNFPPKKR